jgi:hypothetical protein
MSFRSFSWTRSAWCSNNILGSIESNPFRVGDSSQGAFQGFNNIGLPAPFPDGEGDFFVPSMLNSFGVQVPFTPDIIPKPFFRGL